MHARLIVIASFLACGGCRLVTGTGDLEIADAASASAATGAGGASTSATGATSPTSAGPGGSGTGAGSGELVVSGESGPVAIAANQGVVYWSAQSPSAIRRCTPADGCAPETFVSNLAQPSYGVAIDSAALLRWTLTDNVTGGLQGCTLNDCAATESTLTVTPAPTQPMGIAADIDGWIYWGDIQGSGSGPGLFQCRPLFGAMGCASFQLSTVAPVFSVAIDPVRVYWASASAILSCVKPLPCTGTPATLRSETDVFIDAIAVDGVHVYAAETNSSGTGGRIVACNPSDCASPTTIALLEAGKEARGIAADPSSHRVYWTNVAGEILSTPAPP